MKRSSIVPRPILADEQIFTLFGVVWLQGVIGLFVFPESSLLWLLSIIAFLIGGMGVWVKAVIIGPKK